MTLIRARFGVFQTAAFLSLQKFLHVIARQSGAGNQAIISFFN